MANTKNAATFPRTTAIWTEGSAILVMTVSATIPRMSSMIAAPRIALPVCVFSFPSSFNVSTVMLTEVAVNTTPINMFCSKTLHDASDSIIPGLLKNQAAKKPPAIGRKTPQKAITTAAFPLFFNSLISVSSPALNIRTITPSSATVAKKSVSDRTPNIAGPSRSPAASAPTTCGICTFLVATPSNLVHNKIIARSNKNL